jgi:cytochrome P450
MAIPTITGPDLLPRLGQIRANTPAFLLDCARQGDLVRFSVGNVQAFLVNRAEWVRHILQDNHRNYSKNTIQYNSLAQVTGRGLLTSDGEIWFRNRRLEQPAFSRSRLTALDEVVIPAVERMLTEWERAAQGGAVLDVDQEMMRLTLEVVGKALFSIDLSRSAQRLTQATLTALDHIVYQAQNLITPPLWVPTPRNLRFRRALADLDAAVYGLIAERQAQSDPGEDMLGMLLKARDPETGAAMSQREVRDEVITLLIAGHETVASSLTWTWYLLARNPRAWETLRQEVETQLGDRLPTSADLANLRWTGQVFSEALRLYPPAWLITRQSLEADELDGVIIPPGALIIFSPYVLHRHPAYWPNGEAFDPLRFAEATEKDRTRYSYIPFGGGPRLCIGYQFAQIEAQLILAAVTQRFRLELVGGEEVLAAPLVTLRPKGGLHMRAHALISRSLP